MPELVFALAVLIVMIGAGITLSGGPRMAVKVTHDFITGSNNTEKQRLMARVRAYRSVGSIDDGVHLLFQDVQVDGTDWRLMGADNSCARIKSGGLPPEQHAENRWFAISRNWKDAPHFYNSHGSSEDGGKTFYTETALLMVPRAQYQCSPEEVVWHRLRVDELTSAGVPQDERVRIMTAERASKPWEKPEWSTR